MRPYVVPSVAFALGAALALRLTRPDDSAVHAAAQVKVVLAGAPIATKGTEAEVDARLRAVLRTHLRSKVTLLLPSGKNRTTTWEALGARIDEVRLSTQVRALRDPDSTLIHNAARDPKVPLALPLALVLDGKRALAAVASLKDDLDQPPEDAKIDIDKRTVVKEVPGIRLDAYRTLAALDGALAKGDDKALLAAEPVAPQVTAAALGNVDLGDTIGYFETKYATDHKHADRTYNLRIAASKLTGKVILPGETFDFNAVVGPRDEAHGYRLAKVISDGELVDGIGGGTCQVAGTLHGAALFAGLEVVQRQPHTRPSYYIKMGLDAAVAYPHVTLRLKNPFPFPVVLRETVAGGTVRAEILGPKRSHLVTFVRKIDDIIPFTERVVLDGRLPKGTKVVTQRGIPGFKVRRYRIVRDGSNAIREKSVDTYPPTTQIVHVGTGEDTGGGKPNLDDHPEYVADEYLAITQGPGVGSAGAGGGELVSGNLPSGTAEVRVAGKTGTHGWSKHWTAGKVTGVASPSEGSEEDDAPPGGKKVAKRKKP
ncbi:MAG: VanW family protein [Myxococcales bacterium]|nr:VanW family protein [Myxococcales bacterium]